MQQPGLYVSIPTSRHKTDRRFPEPGSFAFNDDRQVRVNDLPNSPFVCPELEALVSALESIKTIRKIPDSEDLQPGAFSVEAPEATS